MGLSGKKLLVTGAMGQLGEAAVRLFLQDGAAVIAHDRYDGQAAAAWLTALAEQYGDERLVYAQADLTSDSDVNKLAETIGSRFGKLDGYLHTTYTALNKPVLEQTLDEWEQVVRGTLTSTFLLCRAVVPLLIASGGGSIVNTSSVISETPAAANSAYGAAKSGVNQFTRTIAIELAKHRIRANALLPGFFNTEEAIRRKSASDQALFRSNTLLERSGTPMEVAETAKFLLSDASSYITGALFRVDGGYHMRN